MSFMRFDSLIGALQLSLQQELDVINVLNDDTYRAPSNGPFTSSIGTHIRHNLDHFEAFFAGMDGAKIDYESRSRDRMIEELPERAKQTLVAYIKKLETLRHLEDADLEVREESDDGVEDRRWLMSSVGRELQFLLGHTVHHNALIAMIVHGHGCDFPESFGVAPSTQRYERERSASS